MVPGPTERLRFREYRDDDAARVVEQFSDEQAQRFFSDFNTEDMGSRWVARMRERQREHGHSLWVLEALDDGRYLGDCGVLLQDVEGEAVLEVGYHLRAAERGRGFAIEAARHCLALAFDELGAQEVGSLVHPDNEPSARVAGRLHRRERRVQWRTGDYRLFYTLSSAR